VTSGDVLGKRKPSNSKATIRRTVHFRPAPSLAFIAFTLINWINSFYRATHKQHVCFIVCAASVVINAHNAVCVVATCTSVCLSAILVYCIKTASSDLHLNFGFLTPYIEQISLGHLITGKSVCGKSGEFIQDAVISDGDIFHRTLIGTNIHHTQRAVFDDSESRNQRRHKIHISNTS